MKIIPLSQGEFTVGADKKFIPFNKEKDVLEQRSTGSLLVEIQPFLMVTSADVILIDLGLGMLSENGKPMIFEALAKEGYNPSDVSKILLSHLHKDHSSGCVFKEEGGGYQLTFPHIPHYILRKEANFAMENSGLSYPKERLAFLFEHGNIKYLEEDSGSISEEISYALSGGHSPYHIVFKIMDDGEIAFYAGDEASQSKQLKISYIAKYDFDGKRAMKLRSQYAEEGKKSHWQFMFYHDLEHAVVML